MKYPLIRTAFFILAFFSFLNAAKIINIPINWPWSLLLIITLAFWLFWEKIYKKKFDFPVAMGSFFLFQLYADTLGNTFNFYNKFNWYDRFTHFSGGIMTGVLIFLIIEYLNKKNRWQLNIRTLIIFAVSVTLTLAVFYEFWEYFAYSVLKDKQIIIGVTDTSDDLLFDFLGAGISSLILTFILKKKNYFLPSSIDSSAK